MSRRNRPSRPTYLRREKRPKQPPLSVAAVMEAMTRWCPACEAQPDIRCRPNGDKLLSGVVHRGRLGDWGQP